jgi:hypothetical protein
MRSPTKYRKSNEYELDWEDNAVSNSLAWASDKVLPRWCKAEGHWTIRLANLFWAECACCLWWRGAAVGLFVGAVVGVTGAMLGWALIGA